MAAPVTDVLIGIDIGTTNLKLLATTPSGEVLHVVTRPMVIHRPQPGWADFDLEALAEAVRSGLREVGGALPDGATVAAIAVDSIGESFVGVDADGVAITNCPTWFDRRTRNVRAEWGFDAERWYDVTGMADDDIATIYRVHWMLTHGGIDAARVERWMNVADYCVFLLSGACVAAPSLAARSGFYDRNTRGWSEELVAAVGLDVDSLPTPVEAARVAGGLRADVARGVGLRAGTPVVNAGHDHPCAGVGCRVVEPGSVMDSTGTAEAVKTVVPGPLGYRATLRGRYDCYPHAVPGRFMLSGHLPSAGGFHAWLSRLLHGDVAPGQAAWPDLDGLLDLAVQSPPGANGVQVLPFLEGTGAPYNRREQTAEVLGLRGFHGRGDLVRAAYEGCAFWLDLNVETFSRIVGRRIETIIAVGGGARSELWLEIKSAFLQRPIVVPAVEEAAAFGTALVGGIAVGALGTGVEDLPTVPSRVMAAAPATQAAYASVAASYRHVFEQRFGVI